MASEKARAWAAEAGRRVGRSNARALSVLVAFAMLPAALGCEPPCVDVDLDGFGAACPAGPDCDDDNAARTDDCDIVPPPDCDADPTETGCVCLAGTVADCFPGPDENMGVGLCAPGRTRCIGGHFGVCMGGVGPSFELCDGEDQDCDGTSDEGVVSPCGGCDRSCRGDVWGGPSNPFEVEGAEPSLSLEVTARGDLTLRREQRATGTVWVPNAADGTVSRIAEASLVETARYETGGTEPSRVAIDAEGDAWIANRAFDGQASIVEIAADMARCVDVDRNSMIRTSTGPSDVLPFGEDECVLRRIDVGGPREIARAMAIDGDRGLDGASGGNVWVGLHDGEAVEAYDGITGARTARVATPGFRPYAAAFDPWGVLYLVSRAGQLGRLDPRERPFTVHVEELPVSCWLLYSLAIDLEGRLGLSGFSCDRVTLYDPRDGTLSFTNTEPSPRGIIAGGPFFAVHTGGSLTELSGPPIRVMSEIDLTGGAFSPNETIGVALGQYVWAISREAGMGEPGLATAVDRATGTIAAEILVGTAPHTQGDLTGIQRFALAAEGALSHVFTGCAMETRWMNLHAEADAGARGAVRFEARHATSVDALSGPFVDVGTIDATMGGGFVERAFPISFPMGGVVEVRVTLSVDGTAGGPRLSRVGLEWACPGPD